MLNSHFVFVEKLLSFKLCIRLSNSDSESVFDYFKKWLKSIDTNIVVINLSNYKKREMEAAISGIDRSIITYRPVIAGIYANEVIKNKYIYKFNYCNNNINNYCYH